jgi:hypothetical protein
LILYCQFPLEEGKIIKLDLNQTPNSIPNPYSSKIDQNPLNISQKTTTIIKKFQGPTKKHSTIRVSPYTDHIYLNQKSEGLKILTNFDNTGYSALIPICLKKRKIVDFQPFETDKVIVLTKDNLLQIFKFQTFGHSEKIAQYNSFPKQLNLCSLKVCPQQRYIAVCNFSESGALRKFEKVVTLKIEKIKKMHLEKDNSPKRGTNWR